MDLSCLRSGLICRYIAANKVPFPGSVSYSYRPEGASLTRASDTNGEMLFRCAGLREDTRCTWAPWTGTLPEVYLSSSS